MYFFRLIPEFVTQEEQKKFHEWFDVVRKNHGDNKVVSQQALKSLQDSIKGWSIFHPFSNTQAIHDLKYSLVEEEEDDLGDVPDFLMDIRNRILNEWNIPNMEENSFMQMTFVGKGGNVVPHYDPAPDGYVTCRCNVFMSTWDGDHIYIDKEKVPTKERDLLCFSASLYKHKTPLNECDRRIFCSFGFLLPYEAVGINFDDPRARLARKIWKSFVDIKGAKHHVD